MDEQRGSAGPNRQGPALVITLGVALLALNLFAGGGPGVFFGLLVAALGLVWLLVVNQQGQQRP